MLNETQLLIPENTEQTNYNFFNWASDHIFTPITTSARTKIQGIVGGGVGLLSSYVFFRLGGEFGNTIANWCGFEEESAFRTTLYWFIGVNTLIPVVSLGISSNIKRFMGINNHTDKAFSPLEKQNKTKKMVRFGIFYLSFFAANQRAYLTQDYLPSSLGLQIPMAAVAWTGAFITYVDVFKHYENNVISRLNCFLSEKTITGNRYKKILASRFTEAAIKISKMNDEQLEEIYSDILIKNADIKSKLKKLYDLSDTITPISLTRTNKGLQYFGIGMGITAAYAYFKVGKDVAMLFCEIAYISHEHCRPLEYMNGGLTTIPIAIMYGITSSDGFSKLYKYITNKNNDLPTSARFPKLRKSVGAFASFEGLMAGVPAVYLTLLALQEQTSGAALITLVTLLGTAAFLSHSSFTFFAVQRLFLHLFDSFMSENKGNDIEMKRDQLAQITGNIVNKISYLDDRHAELVYENLQNPLEIKINDTEKHQEIISKASDSKSASGSKPKRHWASFCWSSPNQPHNGDPLALQNEPKKRKFCTIV